MNECAAKENVFLFSVGYNSGGNDAFDKIKVEFRVLDENGAAGFAQNLGGYSNGDRVPCWIVSNL